MSRARRAIALSDIHLGSEAGYLHSKHPAFPDNRAAFRALLDELGPQDEVVLNGDILDLAMAGLNDTYGDLKEFFKILSETGPYKRVVFIPGNHDHHFWRFICELHFINGRIHRGMSPPSHLEYPYCFIDERFSNRDQDSPFPMILEDLWPKETPVPELVVKYPHHLARVPSKKDRNACYLFTHGHFLEDLFKPMNHIIQPVLLEELEAFNNIWLEAFNYHIGHAGKLSDRARELLKGYEKGGIVGRFTARKVISAVQDRLKEGFNLFWPQTWLLRYTFRTLVRKFSFEKQSSLFNVSIDDKMKENIRHYIQKYILNRYRHGSTESRQYPGYGNIPTPFTFVFGHTHQPIQYPGDGTHVIIEDLIYPLANTGGWLRTDGTVTGNGENAGLLNIGPHGIRWHSLENKLR
ncbi:MAG TPA: hypothetical protein ENN03_09445 [bacterium]|nr:hypothetical protein [bacterium]